jgi:hypothetical protein
VHQGVYVSETYLQGVSTDEAYFWGTQGGAELDLLFIEDGCRLGIEGKCVETAWHLPGIGQLVGPDRGAGEDDHRG